jgi:hypothetical protein
MEIYTHGVIIQASKKEQSRVGDGSKHSTPMIGKESGSAGTRQL